MFLVVTRGISLRSKHRSSFIFYLMTVYCASGLFDFRLKFFKKPLTRAINFFPFAILLRDLVVIRVFDLMFYDRIVL
jgi:hypothetical protein